MANLFKPLITKTDPATGEKVKVKTKNGMVVTVTKIELNIGSRFPKTKNTAQQMLAEIVKKVSHVKSGLAHSAVLSGG